MGLGSLVHEIKIALRAKAAWERLKEAQVNGKLLHTLYVLGALGLTAVAANLFSACPALEHQWPTLVVAGLGTGLTVALKSRSAGASLTVAGVVAGLLAGLKGTLDPVCPGLFDSWQSHLAAGLSVGLGLWLNSPHEPAVKG